MEQSDIHHMSKHDNELHLKNIYFSCILQCFGLKCFNKISVGLNATAKIPTSKEVSVIQRMKIKLYLRSECEHICQRARLKKKILYLAYFDE